MLRTKGKPCFPSSFLFILLLGVCMPLSNSSFSVKEGILVGHSFRTFPVSEWYECLSECASDNICVSYNLKMAKTEVDLVCELNTCGFENRCEAEQNLIKGSGYVFHQLKNAKLEKTCRKRTIETQISSDGIKMTVSCSQRISVYVDGKQLTKEIVLCSSNSSLTYTIPSNSRIIAVKGMDDNRGQPGLIASLSNNIVTDDSWKCTDATFGEWMNFEFNDSKWPFAVVYANNSSPTWPLFSVNGVSESAKWIWSSGADTNRHVYCRKNLQSIVKLNSEEKMAE